MPPSIIGIMPCIAVVVPVGIICDPISMRIANSRAP
jgi:L-serine deaminase